MIRLFKSSFYLQYFVLLLLAAGLWIRPAVDSCVPVQPGPESPLYQMLYEYILSGGMVTTIIGFLLLVLQSFYLNHVFIKHELVPKNSLFTAFLYILVMSQSLPALHLNQVLCASLFVIPALDRILSTYGTPDPTRDVFSAAILLSVASLFYFDIIFIILILFLSFVVFGTFSLRIFFVAIAGIFAVYLYLFLYYFMTDIMEDKWYIYVNKFAYIPEFAPFSSYTQYGLWILQAFLFLIAFLYTISSMNEWNISVRKIILLITYYMLLAAGLLIFALDNLLLAGMITAIPVTIFIAGYLTKRRKVPFILEVYILSWYIASFMNNLFFSEC